MNTPMNELHRDVPPVRDLPPIRDFPPTELEQPDPQLSLSSGKATALQSTLTAIASLFILGLMIYGLNSPLTEPNQTASAPPAQETTGAAPQSQPAPTAAQPQNKPATQAQPEPVKPAQPDDSQRTDTPAR